MWYTVDGETIKPDYAGGKTLGEIYGKNPQLTNEYKITSSSPGIVTMMSSLIVVMMELLVMYWW